ncbi:MAG: Dam family site-specific DNA-(adenine-N6)-methyltransferase, partial [Myxococcota bacterium]
IPVALVLWSFYPREMPKDAPGASFNEDELDPWLVEMRANLGAAGWRERLEEARSREAVVQKVLERVETGETITAAARDVTPQLTPETVAAWIKRYEKDGLAGLINRWGQVAKDTSSPEVHTPTRRTKRPRSFVKWAGSKGQVLDRLLAKIPESYGTYFEPMVGSGALFFALAPQRAVLTDTNSELINCYEVIRDDVNKLVEALRTHQNTYEHFISVRGQNPDDLAPIDRAARTIFLNKTCFNGLYRVNRKGRFNVPYGRIPHANIVDVATLMWAHERLQADVQLHCGDFGPSLNAAGQGDVVYFDPPYAQDEDTDKRTFRHYQADGFGRIEQLRLAKVFRELSARGCLVLLSNADTPLIRSLYDGYTMETLKVVRRMNAKTNARRGWSELLITSEPVSPQARNSRQLTLSFES